MMMEIREIYCNNCKKVLGRYNLKYYSDDKIGDLIKSNHERHVREWHEIEIRRIKTS
ncbi:MAG: hypothetical protein NPMRTH5_320005 [Nitrosopumilales archaeon]|nr:MAG: hypothetical protein NPMRTH5_320005 [Nitrosopumilales archaeon]